ncbi:SHOCT domain-containing protein [Tepidibacillus marianensis]|uniref:SHOCT domain-containing protein n=1 Tax=Tepidibacillus marianensis TaxID=3131995 RepID=UPI0030CE0022
MLGGFGPGRGFGYGMNYFGGFGFGWIIGLIILAMILMLIFRGRGRRHYMGYGGHPHHHNEYYGEPVQPKSSNQEALEILKARYAKGEITEEEYKKMKEVILQ